MLIKPSQQEGKQQELIALRAELQDKGLLHEPSVQDLLKQIDQTFIETFYEAALSRLKLLMKLGNIQDTRTPDLFRPYCPASMSNGSLYLMDQMNGLKIAIDHNKLVTGLGIFGPQGSGKSYEIIHLCNQIRQIDPEIKITIIDPKAGFSDLRSFEHIDLLDISFDLLPPSNVSLDIFLYELMPVLAHSTGLIYGLALLNEAVDIALSQRQQYIDQTGDDPGMSLKDIAEALKSIKVTGFRRTGYLDAAATAIALILGRCLLFACRKGISLDWMFGRNVVLNARSLTDEMQCNFLALYLIFWLYQRARYTRGTNRLKHIIVIDDATRFIGSTGTQFDGQNRTSPLGHMLAVLRESGVCLAYATQLPAQVDSSVLSLTRNALVVGNINGKDNLKVIQSMMSLTDPQKEDIPRFKQRQTLAFISGHDWPHPIHGWTPNINAEQYTTPHPSRPAVDIIAWHPLTDLPKETVSAEAEHTTQQQTTAEPCQNTAVNSDADRLIYDCVLNPYNKVSERTQRLQMPGRVYESAMNHAVQNGFLLRSTAGKTIYLIPTKKAYEFFGLLFPFERSTSVEHSFYVGLIAHILKQDTELSVRMETPIGSKGATIDVTSIDKSGKMLAFEVTISTSNLLSNASKLQDTAYEKIVWLCKDAKTAKATEAFFNKTQSLSPELVNKFEYLHLSKWMPSVTKCSGEKRCQI